MTTKSGKQSSSSGNSNLLSNLQRIQKQLESELKDIEKKIFQDENQYLKDSASYGAITKGWDGAANQQKAAAGAAGGRKHAKFTQLDRLFSYSSLTAPNTEEETKSKQYKHKVPIDFEMNSSISKFKGLTLGKQNKNYERDKQLRAKQANIIGLKNKQKRKNKGQFGGPGSIMGLSNDDNNDGQDLLSDEDLGMKNEDSAGNVDQVDSDYQ